MLTSDLFALNFSFWFFNIKKNEEPDKKKKRNKKADAQLQWNV